MIREIVASIFLLLGSLLMMIAAIGILRLPDVLCRAHALTKAMTMGLSLLLVALWVHQGEGLGVKVAIAIAFQFLTIPVSGHLLGLIVLKKRVPRWRAGGSGKPSARAAAGKLSAS